VIATRIENLRRKVTSWFALHVDDVYLPGEPVSVQVQALSDLDFGTWQQVKSTVAVLDRSTGQEVARREVMVPRERIEVMLGEPGPASYLLTVIGPAGAAGVSDIFAVAS
jgi:hypothetical protein